MKEKIRKIWGIILDILFPPVCLVCRRRLTRCEATNTSESTKEKNLSKKISGAFSFLCPSCSQKIQINNTAFCPVCSRRLPENKKTCHQDSLFILAAAGFYGDEILDKLITLLKYQKIKQAAIPLGEILSRYLENCKLKIENFVIIPVPLHWRREKNRGFNQSDLIADRLSKTSGLAVVKNILKRTRNTPSQVGLKEKEKREINVQNCFVVEKPELLFQKNVILLDDVFTSGATMKEAVEVIKKAGAKKIIGLVVAKA
jgi:ComF family protein